jgi:hypothetical protein
MDRKVQVGAWHSLICVCSPQGRIKVIAFDPSAQKSNEDRTTATVYSSLIT